MSDYKIEVLSGAIVADTSIFNISLITPPFTGPC